MSTFALATPVTEGVGRGALTPPIAMGDTGTATVLSTVTEGENGGIAKGVEGTDALPAALPVEDGKTVVLEVGLVLIYTGKPNVQFKLCMDLCMSVLVVAGFPLVVFFCLWFSRQFSHFQPPILPHADETLAVGHRVPLGDGSILWHTASVVSRYVPCVHH